MRENILGSDENAAALKKTDDGGLDALEIKEGFKQNQKFFLCYISRTVTEMVLAGSLLIYMIVDGAPILNMSHDILCDVHGYWYVRCERVCFRC